MKKLLTTMLSLVLAIATVLSFAGCQPKDPASTISFADEAKTYVQYMDTNLPKRSALDATATASTQSWIKTELLKFYDTAEVTTQDFTFTRTSSGVTTTYNSQNIIATKTGETDEQIIIGAHYDSVTSGNGISDNASGTAVTMAAAAALAEVDTYYTLVFVLFGAEEVGLKGSYYYADQMSASDIYNTKYMINLDTILAGDKPYIYGGIADKDNKTVNMLDAFNNAMAVCEEKKIEINNNPWTYEKPEPTAKNGIPSYPSPTTGLWSDHAPFAKIGIQYIYCEATNWEIEGAYDGYNESTLGKFMHTSRDTYATINTDAPGRIDKHLGIYSTLLANLLTQSELSW